MIPGYPPELGGRNATPMQTLIYMEELARRRHLRGLHFRGYAIVGAVACSSSATTSRRPWRPPPSGATPCGASA